MKPDNKKYLIIPAFFLLFLFLSNCENEFKKNRENTLCSFENPATYENNIKPVSLIFDIKDTIIYFDNEKINQKNFEGIVLQKIKGIYPEYFCKYFLSVTIFYNSRESFETLDFIDQLIKEIYNELRNIASLEIFNKTYTDLNDSEKYKIDSATYYEVSMYEDILKDKGVLKYINN